MIYGRELTRTLDRVAAKPTAQVSAKPLRHMRYSMTNEGEVYFALYGEGFDPD